jgi:tRNA-uridine 2-sulfurtransferase
VDADKVMKKIKAVSLFSGGLDSVLAVSLVLDQDVDILCVNFRLPFTDRDEKAEAFLFESAGKLGVQLRIEDMGEDFLDVVRHPKHGHGSGVNPCIDCKIYMFRRAAGIAAEEGADFIVTGEVLDQRPMSQHKRAMDIIERESGLEGRILRPLSAKALPETIAEKEGLVDRERLLSVHGRSREAQLSLAKEKGLDLYTPPAGGCILTDKFFALKMKDLFEYNENLKWDDVLLLNVGRHFRFGDSKIIVGRNERENDRLLYMKRPGDLVFELPDMIPGPTVLLQGRKTQEALEMAAALTIRYSDQEEEEGIVLFGEHKPDREMQGNASLLTEAVYYNIASGEKE